MLLGLSGSVGEKCRRIELADEAESMDEVELYNQWQCMCNANAQETRAKQYSVFTMMEAERSTESANLKKILAKKHSRGAVLCDAS